MEIPGEINAAPVTLPNLSPGTTYEIILALIDTSGDIYWQKEIESSTIEDTEIDKSGGGIVPATLSDEDGDGVIDTIGGVYKIVSTPVPNPDGIYDIDVNGDGEAECFLLISEAGAAKIKTSDDGSGSEIMVTTDKIEGNEIITGTDLDGDGNDDSESGGGSIEIEDPPTFPTVSISANPADMTTTKEGETGITFTAEVSGDSAASGGYTWYLDGVVQSGQTG